MSTAAKKTKRKAKRLSKRNIELEVNEFKKLIKNENLLRRVVASVEKQQHVQYYTARNQVWQYIKDHKEKELLVVIDHAVDKYVDLVCKCDVGKEKYGRLLASWYEYVGSWAVETMCSDDQRIMYNDLVIGYEGGDISNDDRSCVMHSIFDELFSGFSDTMDAVQSRVFSGSSLSNNALSVSDICVPHNGQPDNDIALCKISGFALHSCINIRKLTIKSNTHKKTTSTCTILRMQKLRQEIKILENLCCKDKTSSELPAELKYLDRGGLILPAVPLLPFLRHYSVVIKSLLNHIAYEDRGSSIFKVNCR